MFFFGCSKRCVGTTWKNGWKVDGTPPNFNSSPLTTDGWKRIQILLGFGLFFRGIAAMLNFRGVYLFCESKVIQWRPIPFATAHLHSPPTTGLELEKRRLKRLDKELEAAQWLWCKLLGSQWVGGLKIYPVMVGCFMIFMWATKKNWFVGLYRGLYYCTQFYTDYNKPLQMIRIPTNQPV